MPFRFFALAEGTAPTTVTVGTFFRAAAAREAPERRPPVRACSFPVPMLEAAERGQSAHSCKAEKDLSPTKSHEERQTTDELQPVATFVSVQNKGMSKIHRRLHTSRNLGNLMCYVHLHIRGTYGPAGRRTTPAPSITLLLRQSIERLDGILGCRNNYRGHRENQETGPCGGPMQAEAFRGERRREA